MRNQFERDGYFLQPDVVAPERIASLIEVFERADMARSERRGETFGARNLLAVPEVQELVESEGVQTIVRAVIEGRIRAVRGLYFDKTEGANWPVPWHQDLTVALARQRDADGWSAWSVKAGTVHAQPPVHILERIVTMRLHLDDCGADNGPLRVLAGSHRFGRLSRDRIEQLRQEIPEAVCIAGAGSALLMRPLILHASSAAQTPRHRRVLHVEFAPESLLPEGLAWAA